MRQPERHRHRRHRVSIVLIALAVVVPVGCSTRKAMNAPRCDGGSTFLVAQSVPTASFGPCFERLPEGWTYESIAIKDNGTTIRLDSDRAGEDAATLRFNESCDVGNAVAVRSDLEGTERFDDIERLQPGFRARVSYRFPGGCLTWTFDFDADASATESVALERVLNIVSRDDLNAALRTTFMDEEL